MQGNRSDRNLGRAIVLLSGGLDSATAAAVAKDQGFELYGLTVIYGQRHSKEVGIARELGKVLGLKEHMICELTLGDRGSALLDPDIEVPVDRDMETEIKDGGIPITYVPARNLILLSIAAHWAETLEAKAIFTGFNSVDFSGYPDCTPGFVSQFQKVLDLGTKAGVEGDPPRVMAPLIDMSKADIIRLGTRLGVPYELTWSCYKGGGSACGRCDSCRLRLKGFEDAGIQDPIRYER